MHWTIRPLLAAGLLAAAWLAAGTARGEVILGYDPARHNRFQGGTFPGNSPVPNPTFYLGSYDFSGVGWVPATATEAYGISMVSPLHFLTATHIGFPVGTTVTFRDPTGAILTRTMASVQQISGSDLTLGRLNAPLPSTVANYPVVLDNQPLLVGAELFNYGKQARVGRNNVSGYLVDNVGTGPTTFFSYDYDPNQDFDGRPGYNPDEFLAEFLDSGSPSFIRLSGTGMALLGTHTAVLQRSQTDPTPIGTIDAYVPAYASAIEAAMAPDGYHLQLVAVPEPTALALLGAVAVGAAGRRWLRRRRRGEAA